MAALDLRAGVSSCASSFEKAARDPRERPRAVAGWRSVERWDGELDSWIQPRVDTRLRLENLRRLATAAHGRVLVGALGLLWWLGLFPPCIVVAAGVGGVTSVVVLLCWLLVGAALIGTSGAALEQRLRLDAAAVQLDAILRGDCVADLLSLKRLGAADAGLSERLGLIISDGHLIDPGLAKRRVDEARPAILASLRVAPRTHPELGHLVGHGPLAALAVRRLEAEGLLRWTGGRAHLSSRSPTSGPYRS